MARNGGSKSKRARMIYNILNPMKKVLENNGFKIFANIGEYYKTMYEWYTPFSESILKLKNKDDVAYKNYIKSIENKGLCKLDIVDGDVNIYHDQVSLLEKENGRGSVGFCIKNTVKNRTCAKQYLKEYFIDKNNIPEEVIQKLIQASLEKIQEDCRNIIRNQAYKGNWDIFELWSAILIYAESENLPEPNEEINDTQYKKKKINNIYMGSKQEIQELYSLEERYLGAKKIVLINYAGTSFFAGQIVTKEVDSDWGIFLYNMRHGRTKIKIVLTDPDSPAAKDAVLYKMRPKTLRIPLEQIIRINIMEIKHLSNKYLDYDLSLNLTDISLPCAYLKSEFDDKNKNNIKVDLYLPSFGNYVIKEIKNEDKVEKFQTIDDELQCDDLLRQSFMVFYRENPQLYEILSKNIDDILEHSKPVDLNI